MRWINSLKFMIGALLIVGDCIPAFFVIRYEVTDPWKYEEQLGGAFLSREKYKRLEPGILRNIKSIEDTKVRIIEQRIKMRNQDPRLIIG